MALLVPQCGEFESLRYLVGANNHVGLLSESSPRNLILKLYTSATTPADGDVPSFENYFEPYITGNVNANGAAVATGYPTCINCRPDQDYTNNYGILLNGSRWTINTTGTATTATYPEQTFTFSSSAGNVYGYFLARAQNMPRSVQGIPGVGIGSTAGTLPTGANPLQAGIVIGDNTSASNNTIGVVGNSYITIGTGIATAILNTLTVGMAVTHFPVAGQPIGIKTGATVVGIDKSTRQIWLSSPVEQNIQVATGCTVGFNYSFISCYDRAGFAATHGLVPGDVLYIGKGNGSGISSGAYTVFSAGVSTFQTTPAMSGLGSCTLFPNIFYSESFTNGPYNIQNNGDQIKITLNVSLE
jgi:hypothetical protein